MQTTVMEGKNAYAPRRSAVPKGNLKVVKKFELNLGTPVYSVIFNAGRNFLVCGGGCDTSKSGLDNGIFLLSIEPDKKLVKKAFVSTQPDSVNCFALFANGAVFACGNSRVWELEMSTEEERQELRILREINIDLCTQEDYLRKCLANDAMNTLWLAATDSVVRVYDAKTLVLTGSINIESEVKDLLLVSNDVCLIISKKRIFRARSDGTVLSSCALQSRHFIFKGLCEMHTIHNEKTRMALIVNQGAKTSEIWTLDDATLRTDKKIATIRDMCSAVYVHGDVIGVAASSGYCYFVNWFNGTVDKARFHSFVTTSIGLDVQRGLVAAGSIDGSVVIGEIVYQNRGFRSAFVVLIVSLLVCVFFRLFVG